MAATAAKPFTIRVRTSKATWRVEASPTWTLLELTGALERLHQLPVTSFTLPDPDPQPDSPPEQPRHRFALDPAGSNVLDDLLLTLADDVGLKHGDMLHVLGEVSSVPKYDKVVISSDGSIVPSDAPPTHPLPTHNHTPTHTPDSTTTHKSVPVGGGQTLSTALASEPPSSSSANHDSPIMSNPRTLLEELPLRSTPTSGSSSGTDDMNVPSPIRAQSQQGEGVPPPEWLDGEEWIRPADDFRRSRLISDEAPARPAQVVRRRRRNSREEAEYLHALMAIGITDEGMLAEMLAEEMRRRDAEEAASAPPARSSPSRAVPPAPVWDILGRTSFTNLFTSSPQRPSQSTSAPSTPPRPSARAASDSGATHAHTPPASHPLAPARSVSSGSLATDAESAEGTTTAGATALGVVSDMMQRSQSLLQSLSPTKRKPSADGHRLGGTQAPPTSSNAAPVPGPEAWLFSSSPTRGTSSAHSAQSPQTRRPSSSTSAPGSPLQAIGDRVNTFFTNPYYTTNGHRLGGQQQDGPEPWLFSRDIIPPPTTHTSRRASNPTTTHTPSTHTSTSSSSTTSATAFGMMNKRSASSRAVLQGTHTTRNPSSSSSTATTTSPTPTTTTVTRRISANVSGAPTSGAKRGSGNGGGGSGGGSGRGSRQEAQAAGRTGATRRSRTDSLELSESSTSLSDGSTGIGGGGGGGGIMGTSALPSTSTHTRITTTTGGFASAFHPPAHTHKHTLSSSSSSSSSSASSARNTPSPSHAHTHTSVRGSSPSYMRPTVASGAATAIVTKSGVSIIGGPHHRRRSSSHEPQSSTATTHTAEHRPRPKSTTNTEDLDAALARMLQAQEDAEAASSSAVAVEPLDEDELIARQLQEEEDRRIARELSSATHPPTHTTRTHPTPSTTTTTTATTRHTSRASPVSTTVPVSHAHTSVRGNGAFVSGVGASERDVDEENLRRAIAKSMEER